MKKIFLFFLSTAGFLSAPAQVDHQQPAATISAGPLSAADWQSDLRFLQHTVHIVEF